MIQSFKKYLLALPIPMLALCLSLSAQATQLLLVQEAGLDHPTRLWAFSPNAEEPQLRFNLPTGLKMRVSLASPYEWFYDEGSGDDFRKWFALDAQSGKQRVMTNTASLKQRFMRIYPERRADGSYFARAILPFHQIIYKLPAGKAPQVLLNRPDLYDFRSLPQGGYVFVTWPVQGRESPDFIDFIPGKKMQLWYQPKSGKLKRLGAFDTVLDLRVVDNGQQVVFFTPGQTRPDQTSWRLIRLPLSGAAPQRVAEIPKLARQRGAPHLATWEHLKWVVYASPMLDNDNSTLRHTFVRHELGKLPQAWFEEQEDVFLKGWSPQGYLIREQRSEGQSDSRETRLQCWQVSSGLQRIEYRWREPYWMQGICVD